MDYKVVEFTHRYKELSYQVEVKVIEPDLAQDKYFIDDVFVTFMGTPVDSCIISDETIKRNLDLHFTQEQEEDEILKYENTRLSWTPHMLEMGA